MKRFFSNPLAPLLAGACLRLLFVFRFSANSGDTVLYEQFASNWLKFGKFAMDINGQPTPVDLRMPGYPAVLAVIYALTGRSGEAARLPVMLVQSAVDLLACVLIAALAALLAQVAGKTEKSSRVFITALWLAALCPFTANYVAVPLTEVWAVFFTALASLLICLLAAQASGTIPAAAARWRALRSPAQTALLAGAAVGLGTLFRPETPLLLVTSVLALGHFWVRQGKTKLWIRTSLFMGLACAAMLLPWTIRNAVTLHEFQPLTPKDAMLPNEVNPLGFMAWEKTWLYRVRDAYLVTWKLNDEEIHFEDIPPWAFDTQDERDRVSAVLEKYNDDLTWNEDQDAEFAKLARERTARHPFRTYLSIPLRRSLRIWFTPRIELLPNISGHVFPLAYQWEEDPVDQRVTLSFFLVNLILAATAICGAWKLWRYPSVRAPLAVLVAYILLRTLFLTTLEAPEPRYTLVCFPALLALAAQAFSRSHLQLHGSPSETVR